MSLISDLNKQACEIYVTRVLAGPMGPPLTDLVDKYMRTMERLPLGSLGEHTLVFATFIAASESVLPEHQQFFTDALLEHHRRNGFANILRALEHLRRIWAGCTTRNWTELLSELSIFVV